MSRLIRVQRKVGSGSSGGSWIDLRTGGASLTIGTNSGDDIRYGGNSVTITHIRDADGIRFRRTAPSAFSWAAWVNFNLLPFVRGNNSNVNFLFKTLNSSTVRYTHYGIGSTAMNLNGGSMHHQGDVVFEFYSQYFFDDVIRGHTGVPGSFAQVSSGTVYNAMLVDTTYRFEITNDGSIGATGTLYALDAGGTTFDDYNTQLVQRTIASPLNPNQTNLFPLIVLGGSGIQDSHYVVAIKVT